MSQHKLWIHLGDSAGGGRRKAYEPFAGADHALCEGACPKCSHVEQAPEGGKASGNVFKAAGTGRRIAPDDRHYEADAVALCCKQAIGFFRVETATLFGIREDEAVLQGRCRVY